LFFSPDNIVVGTVKKIFCTKNLVEIKTKIKNSRVCVTSTRAWRPRFGFWIYLFFPLCCVHSCVQKNNDEDIVRFGFLRYKRVDIDVRVRGPSARVRLFNYEHFSENNTNGQKLIRKPIRPCVEISIFTIVLCTSDRMQNITSDRVHRYGNGWLWRAFT